MTQITHKVLTRKVKVFRNGIPYGEIVYLSQSGVWAHLTPAPEPQQSHGATWREVLDQVKARFAPLAIPVRKTFDYDVVLAALCLWEEITSPSMRDAGEPWEPLREHGGTMMLRELVIDNLAAACDAAWTRAHTQYDADYRNWQHRRQECEVQGTPFLDEAPQDPGSFDWEFVPFWIRNCVDWSDLDNGPRVKGTGTS